VVADEEERRTSQVALWCISSERAWLSRALSREIETHLGGLDRAAGLDAHRGAALREVVGVWWVRRRRRVRRRRGTGGNRGCRGLISRRRDRATRALDQICPRARGGRVREGQA
jgi:hypothetical protein